MKVKFAGKWYEVAMVQYNFGKPYYEIYDEPDTDPEHTDWITHPEEVIDDDGENSSFNTVSNIEEHEYEKESEGSNVPSMIDEAISHLNKKLSIEDKKYLLKNGSLSVHDSLGRYIRNEWGLWGDNSELKKELQDKGFEHPDDMSNHILEEFIKHLISM